jgi:hypothetical protein
MRQTMHLAPMNTSMRRLIVVDVGLEIEIHVNNKRGIGHERGSRLERERWSKCITGKSLTFVFGTYKDAIIILIFVNLTAIGPITANLPLFIRLGFLTGGQSSNARWPRPNLRAGSAVKPLGRACGLQLMLHPKAQRGYHIYHSRKYYGDARSKGKFSTC